jgi:hypothetical protein
MFRFSKYFSEKLKSFNKMCCSVAVLQFQNRLYDSQKLTLYLYINIEVFLGYGNTFKRTATLQQLQQREQSDACINYAERQ